MPSPKAPRETKSDFVTFEDLLPGIDRARQSDDPSRRAALKEFASMAAATLGQMPKRQPRRWTGWIGRNHFWRGRRVVTPNGVVAEVYGVLRGQAAVRWADPQWIENVRRDVVPADQLVVYRNPAAIVMGMLKAGCVERPSELKKATCRVNGAKPCRAGRQRGRPRLRIPASHAVS
jgi:hypothetical protein